MYITVPSVRYATLRHLLCLRFFSIFAQFFVGDDNDEGEDDGRDQYNDTPLPYIIGTAEFMRPSDDVSCLLPSFLPPFLPLFFCPPLPPPAFLSVLHVFAAPKLTLSLLLLFSVLSFCSRRTFCPRCFALRCCFPRPPPLLVYIMS